MGRFPSLPALAAQQVLEKCQPFDASMGLYMSQTAESIAYSLLLRKLLPPVR